MNFIEEKFLNGKIRVFQPVKGYRFSLDSPILAYFVEGSESYFVLDVGCGTGIISFILSKCKRYRKIFGIDVISEVLKYFKRGIEKNKIGDRVVAVLGDFRKTPFKKGSFDVVVSNPPYRDPLRGKISPDKIKAIQTFELMLRFEELLNGVKEVLKENGAFYTVIPEDRFDEFKKLCKKTGFYFEHVISVFHKKTAKKPVFFILKLVKYKVFKKSYKIFLKDEISDEYTFFVESILRGKRCL